MKKEVKDLIMEKISKKPISMETKALMDKITKAVCNYYSVELEDLMSRNRYQDTVAARQMIMYIASRIFKETYTDVGKYLQRDHASCIYASDKIAFELTKYGDKKKALKMIRFAIYEAAIKNIEPVKVKYFCNQVPYEMRDKVA